MESNIKIEKSGKQFVKTKVKSALQIPPSPNFSFIPSSEEHHTTGHSRNSRKVFHSTGSRG